MAWVRSTAIYTNQDNSEYPFALFGNSSNGLFGWYSGSPAAPVYNAWNPPFQNGVFQVYDFKPQFDDLIVGDDGLTDRGRFAQAKWMMLGGLLFETNAAEIQIAFRAPGTTFIPTPGWYEQQALSWEAGGGQRMVSYDLVPLVNGCCEIAFTMKNYPNDGGVPGIGSPNAAGWNLKIKAFGY